MNVLVQPKRVAQILAVAATSLALISIAGQFAKYFLGKGRLWGLTGLFNVDYENNIPTLFAAFILFLASILLFLVASAKQRQNDRFTNHWRVLSILFLYLSLDELLSIHETINKNLGENLQSWQSGPWDILNSVLISVFVLAYINFFLRLPVKIQRLFFIAGSLFVLGALGIELACVHHLSNICHGSGFTAEIIITVEELLEMIGITVFIYAVLLYMNSFLSEINISIVKSTSPSTRELTAKYKNLLD